MEIETASGARIRLSGRAAGREPTAAAVAADLDALWQEHAAPVATGAAVWTAAYA